MIDPHNGDCDHRQVLINDGGTPRWTNHTGPESDFDINGLVYGEPHPDYVDECDSLPPIPEGLLDGTWEDLREDIRYLDEEVFSLCRTCLGPVDPVYYADLQHWLSRYLDAADDETADPKDIWHHIWYVDRAIKALRAEYRKVRAQLR